MPKAKRLYRSNTDKIIAGVAGGLGKYFRIDPVIIRIIFVIIALGYGGGIVLYLIMWLIVPKQGKESSVEEAVEEIKETGEKVVQRVKEEIDDRKKKK